jgi:hypothetical protein
MSSRPYVWLLNIQVLRAFMLEVLFSYKPFSILMAYNIRSMVFGKCAKWQENSAYVV